MSKFLPARWVSIILCGAFLSGASLLSSRTFALARVPLDLTGTPLFLPLVARQDSPTATATANPCGPAPVLLAPASGATLNTLIPTLLWDAGNNLSATANLLEIAQDAAFTQVGVTLNFSPRGQKTYPLLENLVAGTLYYWRVTLKCGASVGWAATSTFTTGAGGTLPGAPDLLDPSDGATVSIPTTLSWSAVTGASQYIVTVQRLSGGPTTFFRTTTNTQYTLVTTGGDVRANSLYSWKSRAQNAYGYSAYSLTRQFTTDGSWPLRPQPATKR